MTTTTLPNKAVATLEAELELCQERTRKALARADAIDPAIDEYGHVVSGANNDALRYLKMSARLALALAKLRGEHTNNINVRKTETVERAPAPEPVHHKPYVPFANRPPDPEREARVQKIYDDWVAAEAARKARGEDDEIDDDDDEWEAPPLPGTQAQDRSSEDRTAEEGVSSEARRAQEGDPPLISKGSNSEK